jgi:hypothetical protein
MSSILRLFLILRFVSGEGWAWRLRVIISAAVLGC